MIRIRPLLQPLHNPLQVKVKSLQPIPKRTLFSSRAPLTAYEKARDFGYIVGTLTGLGLFTFYYYDARSSIHGLVINPLLRFFFDAEESHRLSILAGKWGLVPKDRSVDDKVLEMDLFGKKLSNPIGLAAGYDKHAEVIDPMFDLGFGMVEIGSVTPLPQDGNPKPRFFRLPLDKAVINRYGFNSEGHEIVEQRLITRLWKHTKAHNWEKHSAEYESLNSGSGIVGKLLGINLGKNKVSAMESNEDYINGVEKLGKYADYIVINISSPNTPGLRELQKKDYFMKLIGDVLKARDNLPSPKPALLVKIAPDVNSDELKNIADVALDLKVDGVIISNTTISRPTSLKSGNKDPKTIAETGGLSGPPVLPLALSKVNQFYSLTRGKIPIIGCGGISSGQDAIAFAKAGASAVQFYTHLGYRGPSAVSEIKREVIELLRKDNATWSEIVGLNHKGKN